MSIYVDNIQVEYEWGVGLELDTITIRDRATRKVLGQGFGWNMHQALMDAIRQLSLRILKLEIENTNSYSRENL